MPVAKIHVLEGRYDEARLGRVSNAVQQGLISALGIPPDDFFRSLGGETSDIRLFRPRSLTLKGVAMGSWLRQPPHQRRADVAVALLFAQKRG